MRLRIVDHLRDGEQTVGEIAQALEHEAILLSHHLGLLFPANIVQHEKRGRFVVYRLSEEVYRKSTEKCTTSQLVVSPIQSILQRTRPKGHCRCNGALCRDTKRLLVSPSNGRVHARLVTHEHV